MPDTKRIRFEVVRRTTYEAEVPREFDLIQAIDWFEAAADDEVEELGQQQMVERIEEQKHGGWSRLATQDETAPTGEES